MKSNRFTFDFADQTKLAKALRMHASHVGLSQKEVVVQALEAYLAQHAESELVRSLADQSFAEWDNPDDEIYNTL